jgi:hypothetical protein
MHNPYNEPIAKPLVLQFNEVVKLRQNKAGCEE